MRRVKNLSIGIDANKMNKKYAKKANSYVLNSLLCNIFKTRQSERFVIPSTCKCKHIIIIK